MEKSKHQNLILAGDIGGTKTRIGLFQSGRYRPVSKVIETYPSRESDCLEDILDQFLLKHPVSLSKACFGIAGPVMNGRCQTTNLPWVVSEEKIRRRFQWMRVTLMNDLLATALAVPILNGHEVVSLNKARIRKQHNIALIAPGTGLGVAFVLFRGTAFLPVASEGGHADFAPNNETENELWKYLYGRFGHVSVERVVSGSGLYNIFLWLKDSGKYTVSDGLAKKFKTMDPSKTIAEAAIGEKDPLCVEALNIFISALGSAAGNLALTGMATGGVYLGGGIPPKILSVLKNHLFMQAFYEKGRFRDILKEIAVRVIVNDRAALLGAASQALET